MNKNRGLLALLYFNTFNGNKVLERECVNEWMDAWVRKVSSVEKNKINLKTKLKKIYRIVIKGEVLYIWPKERAVTAIECGMQHCFISFSADPKLLSVVAVSSCMFFVGWVYVACMNRCVRVCVWACECACKKENVTYDRNVKNEP
jgi:hypothetical protein